MKKDEKSKAKLRIDPYSRLVSLPVHAENIFHFPEGLPAFEYVKEFIFIQKPDTTPFMFMHALEPSDISFVCVDPFLICPDYQPRISQADLDYLHLKRAEDLLLLSIVTVTKDVNDTTANLQGPIAINFQASIGKQVICETDKYSVRYRIWDALSKLEKPKKNKKSEKDIEVEKVA